MWARRAETQSKKKEGPGLLSRFLKFVIGIILLPACLGVTVSAWRIYFSNLNFLKEQFWFFAGFVAYVIVYSILQNPIKTYVFGHEFTHAIWTWMFRGKVLSFRAGGSGGSVTVSKSNVFISLAPYFFPVYTVLTMAAYLTAKAFWKVEPYFEIYRFILGFTWAFHLILTAYVLIKGQEDVKENGAIFSAIFIYLANVLVLGFLFVYLSDYVTLGEYCGRSWDLISLQYRKILNFSSF